jgi:hypothetical protein
VDSRGKKCTDSPVSFAELPPQLEQILLKDVGAGQTQKWDAFCKSRKAWQMKWNTTCFSPGTCSSWSADDFKDWEAMVLEIQRMLASFVERLSIDVFSQKPVARS